MRYGRIVSLFLAAVLLLCVAAALVRTASWPLVSDGSIMHYIAFLLRRGWMPYREIVDPNLPGTYLVTLLETRVFGSTAFGWRCFDWSLMAVAAVAMMVALRRHGVLAGIFGAGLFTLLHLADGIAQAGQRDYIVAVLLLAGYGVLTYCTERLLQGSSFVFGLCCGMAAAIKPQALLLPVLLLPVAWAAGEGRLWRMRAVGCGVLAPLVGAWAWLMHREALAAFGHTVAGLMLDHARLARHSLLFLAGHAVPAALLPLLVLALLLMLWNGSWRRREPWMVLAGVAAGFLSFVLQGKAYPYHRYTLLAFLVLFASMQVSFSLHATVVEREKADARGRTRQPALACCLLAYGALWVAPASMVKALRFDGSAQSSLDQLQRDLLRLQPLHNDLRGGVQCMDTVAGCVTVLDRLQWEPATGYLYDCYLFQPEESRVKEELRAGFLAEVMRRPPRVFVVTDQWCLNLPNGYDKLKQWPAFGAFLGANYQLVEEHLSYPPPVREARYFAAWPFGYRIYVRPDER